MNAQVILSVDDEAIILLALKRELKSIFKDRFRYETAMDAEEGLRVMDELELEGLDVILVISDWLMPGMKGDEFLSRVHDKHCGIKTIMITGHADPESMRRVMAQSGTYAVLRKPWIRAELIAAVSGCVGISG
jgi:DNA-binding NtrC family response regulator